MSLLCGEYVHVAAASHLPVRCVCLAFALFLRVCVRVFPDPEHRSSALSQQASMLYVALYFVPAVLNDHKSLMREVCWST